MRLIDADKLKSMYSINQGNFNTVVGIQKWIDNAPTVQAVPQWISVSERLPKDRNTVLVTAYWHETYQVMEASWYDGDDVWWGVPFNNCGEHMRNDLHVIAWMPLPKPYNAESEKV